MSNVKENLSKIKDKKYINKLYDVFRRKPGYKQFFTKKSATLSTNEFSRFAPSTSVDVEKVVLCIIYF